MSGVEKKRRSMVEGKKKGRGGRKAEGGKVERGNGNEGMKEECKE